MKKHLGNIARILITVGIFYYLFKYKIDEQKVVEVLSSANWAWIVVAVGLFWFTFWFGLIRWQMLLRTQGVELPFRRVLAIGFVGHFFNSFLLGATGGDVIKAYYAARQTQTHKAEAVMSVFVDRVVGLFGLLVIAAVMMGCNFRWLWTQPNLRLPALFVLSVIASGCLFIWLTTGPLHGHMRNRLARWPSIVKAADSYRSYKNHGRVLGIGLLLSIGVHVSLIIGVICLARGMGVTGVSWDKFFVVVPVINTIASIPITVAGLGLREDLYVRLFASLGPSPEQAIAISLLSYGVQLFWSLIGGLVYMLWKHEPHMLAHAKEGLAKVEGATGS